MLARGLLHQLRVGRVVAVGGVHAQQPQAPGQRSQVHVEHEARRRGRRGRQRLRPGHGGFRSGRRPADGGRRVPARRRPVGRTPPSAVRRATAPRGRARRHRHRGTVLRPGRWPPRAAARGRKWRSSSGTSTWSRAAAAGGCGGVVTGRRPGGRGGHGAWAGVRVTVGSRPASEQSPVLLRCGGGGAHLEGGVPLRFLLGDPHVVDERGRRPFAGPLHQGVDVLRRTPETRLRRCRREGCAPIRAPPPCVAAVRRQVSRKKTPCTCPVTTTRRDRTAIGSLQASVGAPVMVARTPPRGIPDSGAFRGRGAPDRGVAAAGARRRVRPLRPPPVVRRVSRCAAGPGGRVRVRGCSGGRWPGAPGAAGTSPGRRPAARRVPVRAPSPRSAGCVPPSGRPSR